MTFRFIGAVQYELDVGLEQTMSDWSRMYEGHIDGYHGAGT